MARILVIDDDPDILFLVEHTLKGAGHEVVTSSDPASAAALAMGYQVDGVVLDVRMPEVSGYDALRLLREEPRTGGLPILFLSAHADAQERIRGLREGAGDFLSKPFEPEELVLRVDRLLGHRVRTVGGHTGELDLELDGERVVGEAHLGRYRVLEVVGKGAMGLVFRGWDPALKRPVALKTLRLDNVVVGDAERRELMAKLVHEAATAARFSHPNIVAVYDVAQDVEHAFVAMEYVDGVSLADYLGVRRALDPDQVVALVLGVARGLAAAHAHRIVHHDVKPSNVLLGRDGTIKVGDFGVAQLVTSVARQPGRIFGTAGYLPPETLAGHGYDEKGDLFALGAVAYYCLTGVPAIIGDSLHQVMVNTVQREVIPPRTLAARVPPPLERLILALLAKDRHRRPESARDVVAELCAIYSDEPVWRPDPEDLKRGEGDRDTVRHPTLIRTLDV